MSGLLLKIHTRVLSVGLWYILFMGCGGSADQAPSEGTGPVERSIKPPAALIEALAGTWMPEDYCACLERHRSAYTCGSLLREIYVMSVTRQGPDSLEWGYITTHEGGPMVTLGYDAASGSFSYRSREDEYLGYQVITIRSVDPDHLEWIADENKSPVRFRPVESAEAMLNSALFEGRYALEGDTGLVLFRRDGTVDGLPGIDRFMVLTDFTEGLDDRDIVFLFTGQNDRDMDAYHFQYDEQELFLYPMLAAEEEYVYRMGEMRFHLRRL
jgi:hypothetical protein